MPLTNVQIASYANTGLTAVVSAQEYFNNFLTVSTFGGDYMFQRLHTLNVAFTAIKTNAQSATPVPAEITAQVTVAETAINELQSYYNNYLTVSSFGGNHLFELLQTVKTNVDTIQAG